MQRALWLTLLMTAVTLAGCTDGDGDDVEGPTSAECLEQGLILNATANGGPRCEEPPFEIRDFEDPDHHCVVTRQRDRVHAPDLVGNPWVLGQSWTYSLGVDGEDLGTTQMVYYDDQDFDSAGTAQHYMVGTPTREEALRHAIFSENPMLGRVHRILYSPHESGDHADMFHFPLCDGSTWTTMFYGETFTLTAESAPVPVPSGSDDGFLITGSSEEGSTLKLTYSPAAQWFTVIDLDRADGGTVDMALVETDTGHSGDAFFLRGQKDATLDVGVALPAVSGVTQQTFTRENGDDGPYDTVGMWIDLQLAGDGFATMELQDPNGTVQYTVSLGGMGGSPTVEALVEVPFSAGEWVLDFEGASLTDTGPGSVTGEVRLVSIYDRSGSV